MRFYDYYCSKPVCVGYNNVYYYKEAANECFPA